MSEEKSNTALDLDLSAGRRETWGSKAAIADGQPLRGIIASNLPFLLRSAEVQTASPTELQLLLPLWLGALGLIWNSISQQKNTSIGLPLAVFFATCFEYVGAFAYAVPGYSHLRTGGDLWLAHKYFTADTVLLGLQQTTIALGAFALGTILSSRGRKQEKSNAVPHASATNVLLVLAGLTAFGILLAFVSLPIPMVQAFWQVCRNAAVVFVSLGALIASQKNGRAGVYRWMLIGLLIPIFYLTFLGFMSYGFLAFVFLASFFALRLPRRPMGLVKLLAATLATGYGLLSVFVVYMSYRRSLREAIWGGASISERLEAIFTTFSDTRLLDPFNYASLDWLVIRLNQSMYVGKVVEMHTLFPELRQHGESLLLAVIAWIPRFLWPKKPEAGGSQMILENTDIDQLSESATFGAGAVIEFYVNFGTLGVAIGYFVLGWVVRWLDRMAGRACTSGDHLEFAKYACIGIAIIKPLESLFFVVNTAIATAVVFWMVGLFFRLRRSRYQYRARWSA